MSISFSIIVAVDQDFGIGKSGKLPWKLSADLIRFKVITTRTDDPSKKNMVVMGRKTWESLPSAYRPLPGRINCVVSRNAGLTLPKDVLKTQSLEDALEMAGNDAVIENVFVIGGAELYQAAVSHKACHRIFMTRIDQRFDCDVFFPKVPAVFDKVDESPARDENQIRYVFQVFERH